MSDIVTKDETLGKKYIIGRNGVPEVACML
jgi:hypothetical protein